MENNKYKLTMENRLTKVETNQINLGKKVDCVNKKLHEFVDNHFNGHIKDFDKFKTWVYILLITNLLGIIGFLVSVLIK